MLDVFHWCLIGVLLFFIAGTVIDTVLISRYKKCASSIRDAALEYQKLYNDLTEKHKALKEDSKMLEEANNFLQTSNKTLEETNKNLARDFRFVSAENSELMYRNTLLHNLTVDARRQLGEIIAKLN